MASESPAAFNQASSYGAEQLRRSVFAQLTRTGANSPGIISGGLLSAADLQLSAPGSGMSVLVSTGEAIIGGSEGGSQGGYYARGTSTTSLVIAGANATNPRIDTVCATVSDSAYTEPTGGSGNQWTPQVVTGTATPAATLTNLLGAAALPLSSLLLGYVLVPASATNIITADIANVAVQVTSVTNLPGWRLLTKSAGTVGAGGTGLALFTGAGGVSGTGAGNAAGVDVFYFDPATLAIPGKTLGLSLRGTLACNATAPGVTISVSLYPVTAIGGAANLISATLGAAVTGSTVTFSSSALASGFTQGLSGNFTPPAAGLYAIGTNYSSASAANSAQEVEGHLFAQYQ